MSTVVFIGTRGGIRNVVIRHQQNRDTKIGTPQKARKKVWKVLMGQVFLTLFMILNLNCFYSIFAKKCDNHGHFEYQCVKRLRIFRVLLRSRSLSKKKKCHSHFAPFNKKEWHSSLVLSKKSELFSSLFLKEIKSV